MSDVIESYGDMDDNDQRLIYFESNTVPPDLAKHYDLHFSNDHFNAVIDPKFDYFQRRCIVWTTRVFHKRCGIRGCNKHSTVKVVPNNRLRHRTRRYCDDCFKGRSYTLDEWHIKIHHLINADGYLRYDYLAELGLEVRIGENGMPRIIYSQSYYSVLHKPMRFYDGDQVVL